MAEEKKTIRVKALKPFLLKQPDGTTKRIDPGKVVEVTEKRAHGLFAIGAAEPAEKKGGSYQEKKEKELRKK